MSLEILTCYIQPKPMNTTPHSHHISQLNVCAQIPQQQQPSALQQNFSPSRRTVKIRAVSTREELVHALSLRAKVYIHELHHSSTNHFDEFDNWPLRDGVTHYLVIVDKVAIGTCRLNTLSAGVNLERLAVDSRVRRRGVGHALLRHLERLPIIVNSQGPYFCHALKDQEFFFFSSGWVVEEGHDVDEQKYPTIAMVRRRRPCGAAAMGCKSLSHVMVRTIDISSARKFYSLLGFQDVSRFKVNGVRGVWIEVCIPVALLRNTV